MKVNQVSFEQNPSVRISIYSDVSCKIGKKARFNEKIQQFY